MPSPVSNRLYLRGLPSDATKEQLSKLLSPYGLITEVKILPHYAFVQYQSTEDATKALEDYSNCDMLGKRVVIEFAHPLRRNAPSGISSNNTSPRCATRRSPASRTARGRHPIVVLDLPRDIGWKELKDFGRSSGALVSFCDLDRVQTDRGFIEFFTREDAQRAIEVLDGQYLGGQRVRVVDHEGLHTNYGSYAHHTRVDTNGRSRSPRRNRLARSFHENTSNTDTGHSKYPGDSSSPHYLSYDRRRRSQEDEYDYDYDHETLARRVQDSDLQIKQEASYTCHRRTWIAAADVSSYHQLQQDRRPHHFDYQSQNVYPEDHAVGEQYRTESNDYTRGHEYSPGYDYVADAEYGSRLHEAHHIQQRLMNPYQ